MADKFARVLRAIREEPWAMLPEAFEALLEIVAARIEHGPLTAEELLAKLGDRPPQQAVAVERVGAVAVVPLYGLLSHRMNLFTAISGGTSTALFAKAVDELMPDPEVAAIVVDADTPGGAVAGTEEAALVLYRARQQHTKPIVFAANTLLASGGYWLGAQAHQIVASPSSRIGSIGIAMEHTDVSKAQELQGVKTTLVRIPAGKLAVNQYESLTDETRGLIVSGMQPFLDLFHKAVARGRGVSVADVRDGYGQGAVLAAIQARDASMVDRIETLADVVARLSTPQGRRAVLAASIAQPRAMEEGTAQELPPAATAQEPPLWRHVLRAELDTLRV